MAILGGIIVLIALVFLLFFVRRIQAGHQVFLRHIPAFDRLPLLMSQAVESGQKIHVSVGTGMLTDSTAASTLAGLAILDFLAERGCGSGAPPQVTVADPLVMLAAQDSLRQAYSRNNRLQEYSGTQVEFVAPQPTTYALGASMRLDRKETSSNLMVGSFGPEVLLLAEPGAQIGVKQVGGTDDPQAMALLAAASDDLIVGEEIFAVPAYLERKPGHLASLRVQDMMRSGVVILILIAVFLRTFGVVLF